METEHLDEAAASLRRVLALMPPAGPRDVAMRHQVAGAAAALEAAATRSREADDGDSF